MKRGNQGADVWGSKRMSQTRRSRRRGQLSKFLAVTKVRDANGRSLAYVYGRETKADSGSFTESSFPPGFLPLVNSTRSSVPFAALNLHAHPVSSVYKL